ncbi:MAG: hypothetical protein ABIZ04_09965 [Opitutus sp.]
MNPEISTVEFFKRPSAFLPILFSLIAVGLIVAHIATDGLAPQPDEGTAAHLWQLVMAAQVPLVGYFVIRWVPVAPRVALPIFGAQITAALIAVAPIFLLKW